MVTPKPIPCGASMYAWLGLVYFPLSTEFITSNTLSDLITLEPEIILCNIYHFH